MQRHGHIVRIWILNLVEADLFVASTSAIIRTPITWNLKLTSSEMYVTSSWLYTVDLVTFNGLPAADGIS